MVDANDADDDDDDDDDEDDEDEVACTVAGAGSGMSKGAAVPSSTLSSLLGVTSGLFGVDGRKYSNREKLTLTSLGLRTSSAYSSSRLAQGTP